MEHALAKANDGNVDQGPVLKVSERADHAIIGWFATMEGQGRSERMGAALSPKEKETG